MNKSKLSPMGRRIFVGMVATGIATEAEFARRVGISPQAVQRWLYARLKRVDAETLLRISDCVHLSARWLLSGKGSPAPRRAVTPTQAHLLRQYERLPAEARSILRHCLADLSSPD
jgi:transcriptional regulator with XRE-family HTH domain